MGQLKAKYVSTKVNVEQNIPQIFIVDKAVKAERKAVPKTIYHCNYFHLIHFCHVTAGIADH